VPNSVRRNNISTINKNFEDVTIKDNSVDLVIGNPPYGKWTVTDKKNPDLAKHAIHHYFASRGVRLLKKNGILAFVINQYFMDNIFDHVRDIIDQEGGSLLAAYRLPETLFDNAKVTTDIIFIVKDKLPTKWLKTKPITVDKETKQINEYYINNPQNILGDLRVIPIYERTGLVCQASGSLKKKLDERLEAMPKKYIQKLAIENYLNKKLATDISELVKSTNNKLYRLTYFIRKNLKAKTCLRYIDFDYKRTKGFHLTKYSIPEKEHYFELDFKVSNNLLDTTQRIYFESVVTNYIKKLIQDSISYKLYFHYG